MKRLWKEEITYTCLLQLNQHRFLLLLNHLNIWSCITQLSSIQTIIIYFTIK